MDGNSITHEEILERIEKSKVIQEYLKKMEAAGNYGLEGAIYGQIADVPSMSDELVIACVNTFA